tara:strand:+ start:256 stop:591 length:336 start_codon:yes stop_codon:yes gene_type:complete
MYTKNELIEQMSEQITDIIKEASEYTNDINEVQDTVNDEIFNMINHSEFVIYTNKAKEISKTINLYDVFDTSDISGERFDNWSQVAFENLYALIYNEIDVNELIETILNNK